MHLKANVYCILAFLEQLVQGSLHLLHAAVHLSLLFTVAHGIKHFQKVLRTILQRFFHISKGYKQLAMIFEPFVQDPKGAVAYHKGVCRIIWFSVTNAFPQRILMLLLVLLQVAHVEVFLVASFDFAHIFSTSFFVLQVNLYMLFQVSGCCEGFTAFFANEGLLLSVDASMAVEVGFLVKLLIALVEVAFIGPCASMDQFVSLQS